MSGKIQQKFFFLATRLNFVKNSEMEVLDNGLKVYHLALMTVA
jgi:hypothetical protein